MTALMGMNVVGGVVVYGDEFGGGKAVATVLCVWGFCSYVWGLYVKKMREERGYDDGDDKVDVNGGGGGMEMIEIVTGGGCGSR